jgi:hypothetical protein
MQLATSSTATLYDDTSSLSLEAELAAPDATVATAITIPRDATPARMALDLGWFVVTELSFTGDSRWFVPPTSCRYCIDSRHAPWWPNSMNGHHRVSSEMY